MMKSLAIGVQFTILIGFLFVCGLLGQGTPNDMLTSILEDCQRSQSSSRIEAHFAPIKCPSSGTSDGSKEWSCEYVEKAYPKNTYVIGTQEVDYVSLISKRPGQGIGINRHLWHVIVVPSIARAAGGYIAEHSTAKDTSVWTDSEYKALRLSMKDGTLFYLRDGLNDVEQSDITTYWRDSVGMDVFGLVQEPGDYNYTFIFQKGVPIGTIVRDDGYRQHSHRKVSTSGMAYGLVLNDHGHCVSSATPLVISEKKLQ